MDDRTRGWINGFIGMAIFSASLPATKVVVTQLDPVFVTLARATIAGCVGGALLVGSRQSRPTRAHVPSLIIAAAGVVIGFPLLTALALRHISSSHSLIFIGLLPLSTALFGVWRAGERPQLPFWLFSGLGSSLIVIFALTQGGDATLLGDVLMFAAIVVCGLGYAEGARLSRTLGGWQVISWALVISLPIVAPLMLILLPPSFAGIDTWTWIGLAYISLFSMLIGFVFWYRGLALGGIGAVGQLQLVQPFCGMAIAAALLHEKVSWSMIVVTVAIIFCVAGAKRVSAS